MKPGIPILASGNPVIFKPAPNLTNTARVLQETFEMGGFTEAEVSHLFASDDQCAELIADKRLRGVNFTGSTAAGRKVAALASANLKKSSLELGGSDPFIICADANIPDTVE